MTYQIDRGRFKLSKQNLAVHIGLFKSSSILVSIFRDRVFFHFWIGDDLTHFELNTVQWLVDMQVCSWLLMETTLSITRCLIGYEELLCTTIFVYNELFYKKSL